MARKKRAAQNRLVLADGGRGRGVCEPLPDVYRTLDDVDLLYRWKRSARRGTVLDACSCYVVQRRERIHRARLQAAA